MVADSDDTKALRALSRAREDLVQTRVGLTNQLRAELERFWPGAAVVFRDIDSPISLAFLARYPSPMDTDGLGEKRLAAFLARHAYCGRKQPAELLTRLRDAPQGRAGDAETEARRAIVLALVACFRRGCDRRLRAAIATLADATRHWHPWAADRYATARARGQDHQRAIRTLGRAWCRVIWRCWQDHTTYDPTKHRAATRHLATGG